MPVVFLKKMCTVRAQCQSAYQALFKRGKHSLCIIPMLFDFFLKPSVIQVSYSNMLSTNIWAEPEPTAWMQDFGPFRTNLLARSLLFALLAGCLLLVTCFLLATTTFSTSNPPQGGNACCLQKVGDPVPIRPYPKAHHFLPCTLFVLSLSGAWQLPASVHGAPSTAYCSFPIKF